MGNTNDTLTLKKCNYWQACIYFMFPSCQLLLVVDVKGLSRSLIGRTCQEMMIVIKIFFDESAQILH